MHVKITATVATVFLHDKKDEIDKIKLRKDYHELYHSKRPADPVIFDKFIFVNQTEDSENLSQIKIIDDLIKIHDLRSVNFIIISNEEKPISDDLVSKFRDQLNKWDVHFKRNSFSGFLSLRICTQNFQADLVDKYQVRRIKRLPLTLKSLQYS